jgi:hypothetical protein
MTSSVAFANGVASSADASNDVGAIRGVPYQLSSKEGILSTLHK